MSDVLVIGSPNFSDVRAIKRALRRVEEVYRGPHTLIHTTGTALASLVVGSAREQGWTVRSIAVDQACASDCTPGHRRTGGPEGTFCPVARRREHEALMRAVLPNAVLVFNRVAAKATTPNRVGQHLARDLGLATWEYTQVTPTKAVK